MNTLEEARLAYEANPCKSTREAYSSAMDASAAADVLDIRMNPIRLLRAKIEETTNPQMLTRLQGMLARLESESGAVQ